MSPDWLENLFPLSYYFGLWKHYGIFIGLVRIEKVEEESMGPPLIFSIFPFLLFLPSARFYVNLVSKTVNNRDKIYIWRIFIKIRTIYVSKYMVKLIDSIYLQCFQMWSHSLCNWFLSWCLVSNTHNRSLQQICYAQTNSWSAILKKKGDGIWKFSRNSQHSLFSENRPEGRKERRGKYGPS
jgi:hypothetical protein